jgi:hypothetical protein
MVKRTRARGVVSVGLGIALVLGALVFASAAPGAAAPKCPPSKPGCAAPPPSFDGRCVVWLHGLGGRGSATVISNGVKYIYPDGNAPADGGGRRWAYFGTNGEYESARGVVEAALSGMQCTRTVIDGFSNGGGFAGKLFCRNETFGDANVVGYIADDPVTDYGVDPCTLGSGLNVAMYWTGALQEDPILDCAINGWWCEGNRIMGPDAYADALGLDDWARSPHRRHKPYMWPPEVAAWLG